MGPVAGSLVATGIGAVAGLFGGHQANKTNQREAERNRAFQAGEARTNRAFQERMRNTEWQAAVEDMRQAGLNPALAYARGGASSPSGSMASGSQAAPAHDVVSSAMQGIRLRKDLEMMSASIEKTRNESRTARAIADREEARNRAYGFKRNADGSIAIDFSMPGIVEETQASIRRAVAEANRAGSMADIAGVGGQVAGAFEQFMPAVQRITGVAAQGAEQMAGVIEMLERAARMRDSAVQAWLGFPKKAALSLLNSLRRRRN